MLPSETCEAHITDNVIISFPGKVKTTSSKLHRFFLKIKQTSNLLFWRIFLRWRSSFCLLRMLPSDDLLPLHVELQNEENGVSRFMQTSINLVSENNIKEEEIFSRDGIWICWNMWRGNKNEKLNYKYISQEYGKSFVMIVCVETRLKNCWYTWSY